MSDLEAVQRNLDTLREDFATRARRMRIFGVVLAIAGIALLVVGIMVITSPSGPTHDPDYLDAVSASARHAEP